MLLSAPFKKEYDRQFQTQIVALCYQDVDFLKSIAHVVSPDMFESSVLGEFFRIIRDFYLDYTMRIGKDALKNEIRKLKKSRSIKKRHKPQIKAVYNAVKKKVKNAEYIKGEVLAFCRKQGMKAAVIEAAGHLQNEDYPAIEKTIIEASQIGLDLGAVGHRYFSEYPERVVRRQRDWPVIPTGIVELDDKLRGGGVKRGHTALWLAPTKRGKTMALAQIAKAALIRKERVIFYTLEMDEDDIAHRFDSMWTGLTSDKIDDNYKKLYKKLNRLKKQIGDALIIKHYPAKSVGVETIRAHIKNCQSAGFDPTMLVLDYAELLKSASIYQDKRHEITETFAGFHGLNREMGTVGWSALQTNRSSFKKAIVDMDDSQESMGPVQMAELAVSLSQTKKEYRDNIMRLFIAANRHGPMGAEIPIRTKYSTATFYSRPVH